MFTVGKKYKYAGDGIIRTCHSILPSGAAVMVTDSGYEYIIHKDLLRFCTEYVEKKRGTMFVNIYENPHHTWVHINKHNADTACPHHGMPRIACIEVPWEEGQGL